MAMFRRLKAVFAGLLAGLAVSRALGESPGTRLVRVRPAFHRPAEARYDDATIIDDNRRHGADAANPHEASRIIGVLPIGPASGVFPAVRLDENLRLL